MMVTSPRPVGAGGTGPPRAGRWQSRCAVNIIAGNQSDIAARPGGKARRESYWDWPGAVKGIITFLRAAIAAVERARIDVPGQRVRKNAATERRID